MPYHVILQIRGLSQPVLRTDLSEVELHSRFLEPYAQGTPFVVDGRTISLQGLERIKIHESDDPIAAIVEQVNASDDRGLVAHLGDIRLRAAELSRDVTDDFITRPPGHALDAHSSSETAPVPPPLDNSVFLVHGRNTRVNGSLRELLRALGLQVVEWSHAVQQTGIPSPMTADIVDQGFAMSHATVVLMTPDDLAQIHPDLREGSDAEGTPEGQPRPNVLFEAGMAWAQRRDRTVIVEVGALRGLTDLAGVNVVRLENSAHSRLDLVQRLKLCGCRVDDSGRDWISAGNFGPDSVGSAGTTAAGLSQDPSVRHDAEEDLASARSRRLSATTGNQVTLRLRLLKILKAAAIDEASAGRVGQLDLADAATDLGVSEDLIVRELAEMLVDGAIEPHAQTLGRSASQGACRITRVGLEELRSFGEPSD